MREWFRKGFSLNGGILKALHSWATNFQIVFQWNEGDNISFKKYLFHGYFHGKVENVILCMFTANIQSKKHINILFLGDGRLMWNMNIAIQLVIRYYSKVEMVE